MSLTDIIIISVILEAVAFVALYGIRRIKKGQTNGSGCGSCCANGCGFCRGCEKGRR